jgi:hypothetical protein
MIKSFAIVAVACVALFCSPLSAQYAVQFDSTAVWLNGVDLDSITISLRDKPGRAWRIDTTGAPHLEAAKVGQRVLFPDSVYVILQRSNKTGTADSFRVGYAAGLPTSTTATIGPTTYIIATSTTFANVTTNTAFSLPILRQSTWLRFFVNQGDLTGTVTYFRMIFVRKERTN